MEALQEDEAESLRLRRPIQCLRKADWAGVYGGIAGLLWLLREHTDALEASLQASYGIDLREIWRGGLTLRRLRVLIRHLPPDSPLIAALGGPGWCKTDLLLADLVAAWTGKPHPSDPRQATVRTREDESRVKSAEQESRARRERFGIVGSVLD